MTDPNNDENLQRTWTPSPNTPHVPPGDPFGHYTSEQPEPFVVTTGDPDDADR
ncbi:hypothetical protein [Mycobacteroides abscessus]|uniref:hypothetical protein n=1 Tax=Mycobacteroides abscessus TaxID=36809 RepID=UPI00092A55C0|nr:hypothetical protein [Mycobacteroides abscessus]MBE5451232.1 hypothetical protein [Mycobacteroides abscessus]MDO3352113.1 hypothetical protein [Mycobacteroides abscessus subsp. abscessus]SHW52605.1 Uncharacterised protein [Mycobacteroides abscessus subsp. abscessus]SHX58021.1 Uncharacterised protein [Mycobacteroides abscessus subsp. abscessus]SHZ68942.1 Uncharacterised protein [Mycobacteroides abscessus subsp. abscessus]